MIIKNIKNIINFLYRCGVLYTVDRIWNKVTRLNLSFLSDEVYLKKDYKLRTGKTLNLENPQTFNEKLQWLKINDRKDIYTIMVDKYEAKKYVASIIGDEYIIPTIGVYERFDNIDFDTLPDKFVIKTTHDSGTIFLCKDKSKFNKYDVKKKINDSLKRNYYYPAREWPYKNVKPRILIETYMEDNLNNELNDYKFMCFNGKVKCSFVCTDRYSVDELKVTFFDRNWNLLPFERHYKRSNVKIKKPINYDKMLEISNILSSNTKFLRVDLYEINGKIYFGELTFYPGAGYEEFTPEKYDKILGDMIELK